MGRLKRAWLKLIGRGPCTCPTCRIKRAVGELSPDARKIVGATILTDVLADANANYMRFKGVGRAGPVALMIGSGGMEQAVNEFHDTVNAAIADKARAGASWN